MNTKSLSHFISTLNEKMSSTFLSISDDILSDKNFSDKIAVTNSNTIPIFGVKLPYNINCEFVVVSLCNEDDYGIILSVDLSEKSFLSLESHSDNKNIYLTCDISRGDGKILAQLYNDEYIINEDNFAPNKTSEILSLIETFFLDHNQNLKNWIKEYINK